jgi:hypothetical protein
MVSKMRHGAGGRPVFPPLVATYLVKLACELPDDVDRSLSLWTCAELARTAVRDEVVDKISLQSVQRMLRSHTLRSCLACEPPAFRDALHARALLVDEPGRAMVQRSATQAALGAEL